MTLVWMVPVTEAAAVLFALWLAYDVLRRDTALRRCKRSPA